MTLHRMQTKEHFGKKGFEIYNNSENIKKYNLTVDLR